MKYGIFLVLTVLMAVGITQLQASEAVKVEMFPGGQVAQASDFDYQPPVGPRRDPGEDEISYDDWDGGDPWAYTVQNYWSRVSFDCPEEFELQGFRFVIFNPNAVRNPAISVFIYPEDGNRNLQNAIWQTQIQNLPSMEWIAVDLDEDDYTTFDRGERFSIVFGRAPGGNWNDGAQGWWHAMDDTDNQNSHSYINMDANPPSQHASWTGGQGARTQKDIILRANGEFAGEIINLSLTQATIRDEDDEPRWTTVVGQERFFHARIQNRGAETNGYILEYVVSDADGQDVWDDTIVNQERLAANAVVDETFEAWEPDTPGLYTVEISVTPFGDDVDPTDNAKVFEFMVVDPVNDPDMWLTYCDQEYVWERNYVNEDSTAFLTYFYHPGGEESYSLTDFRVCLRIPANTQQEEIPFSVFSLDLERGWTITYSTEVEVDETGDAVWIEVEVPEESRVAFDAAHAMVVGWFFRTIGPEDTRIAMKHDETPPISGATTGMPPTNYWGEDIWEFGFNHVWTAGEWAIEAKLVGSEPEGRRLTIEPESLEFGYGLQHAQDHTVSANFISYGTDTVHVTSLDPARTLGRYLTFAAAPWAIAPQETLTVDFTFNADTLIDIFESSILITSDAENLDQRYIWGAQASTMNRVIRADLDNINFGFDCELDVNRNVDVTFSNPAPEALTVTGIEIPEEPAELRESFFFSVEQFEIPGEGEQIVTFTFRPQQVMSVNTRFTVLNTSENDLDLSIRIIASTLEVAENVRPGVPEEWSLGQNYPNPFNPLTTVDFALPAAGEVDFAVFDMSGRRVLDVFNGNLPAGYHSLNLDAGNLTPGVYIYRLSAPDYTSARKMVLLK